MSGGRRRFGSVSPVPKCRTASLRGPSTVWKRRALRVAPVGIRRAVLADNREVVVILVEVIRVKVVILLKVDTPVDLGNKAETGT